MASIEFKNGTGMNPVESQQYFNNLVEGLNNGTVTPLDFYGAIVGLGGRLSPEMEKYLDNLISGQRTSEARDYETNMANTDLLRAAQQLGSLGLSPSNVLSTGGSATPNVAAASTPQINLANQRLDRQKSLANSLIGMAGRMASSGIYGSALMSVKKTAAKTAAMASHSARIINHLDNEGNVLGSTEETIVKGPRWRDAIFDDMPLI